MTIKQLNTNYLPNHIQLSHGFLTYFASFSRVPATLFPFPKT